MYDETQTWDTVPETTFGTVTECAICYTTGECYDDGEAFICKDRQACRLQIPKTIAISNSLIPAIVDAKWYAYLSQWPWHLDKKGYVRCSDYSIGTLKTLKMHRIVLGLTNPKMQGDHINRNKLDNRTINLRIATNQQNKHNSIKMNTKNSTSKYKGVYWHKANSKWVAAIADKGKRHIGTFDTEIEAAKAYNAKAIELFGEFARINEI
jgi:hypothetical protein